MDLTGSVILAVVDILLLVGLVKVFSGDEVPWWAARLLGVGVCVALLGAQFVGMLAADQTASAVLGGAVMVVGGLVLAVGVGLLLSALYGMTLGRAVAVGLIVVAVHGILATGISLRTGRPRRPAQPVLVVPATDGTVATAAA